MIIDTSVLVTILLQEPELARFARAIAKATTRLISAASVVEAGIIMQAWYGDEGAHDLDLLVFTLHLTIAPVTARQATIARSAYRSYGKGQQHPAELNYGDLFAYALAKETGEALLYKGADFVHTDITTALY